MVRSVTCVSDIVETEVRPRQFNSHRFASVVVKGQYSSLAIASYLNHS